MSDVLNKIGEGLKTTLKQATKQTQKSVDQVAYRTELLNKKNELKKMFELLGEAQYKIYTQEGDEVERNVLYSKITTLKKTIEEIEYKLKQTVDEQKTSFDSYKNKVKTVWEQEVDPLLKKKEDTENKETVETLKICPVCHTANHEYAAYCTKCGNKFE